jgi:hypothetical protein
VPGYERPSDNLKRENAQQADRESGWPSRSASVTRAIRVRATLTTVRILDRNSFSCQTFAEATNSSCSSCCSDQLSTYV